MSARVGLALIGLYQRALSPLLGPTCRFHPSCSSYTATCIERFGLWRGALLGLGRLVRCHPWSAGGVDRAPVALGTGGSSASSSTCAGEHGP